MQLQGRTHCTPAYPFGYQGSEKDAEITSSQGSHITTFFREADLRILQWLSVDPKTALTPWESPYVMMGRNALQFNDPLGDKIKFASKEDRNSLKQHFKTLKKESYTAKMLIKDLKRSDHIHTFSTTTEDSETEPTADNITATGSGTMIKINLNSTPEAGGPGYLITAHEIGHAWRFDQGKVEPSLPTPDNILDKNLNMSVRLKMIQIRADRVRITEEKEASHIENIIRAEIDPSGEKIKLRTVYSNIKLNYPILHQIPSTDVIKPGYNYYNPDKKAKYQSLTQ